MKNQKLYLPDFKFLFDTPILPYLIIAFGVAMRLIQYLSNRSLWADEAVLALNIVNRSYLELFQPLDYDQGAPIGFLIIEKLAVQILGNNEYALRLFPLICGIGSLFLFYELAKKWMAKSAIIIGLTLFANLQYLVYYSAEVKQYSNDVAIALLLYLLLLPLLEQKLNQSQIIKSALVGAIAIWFSHPSIFILASIGGSALLINYWQKDLTKIKQLLLIYSGWIFSFIIFYFVSLRNLTGNETLTNSWGKAFPSSPFDIIWMLDAFGKFFYKPLGFGKWIDGLAIVFFLLGCIACWLHKKKILLLLLSPILMTFLASFLHQYPFRSRLVLFLTPFVIFLIAESGNYLLKKSKSRPIKIISLFLIILLLKQPVVKAIELIEKPLNSSEIKPVLNYIQKHQQPGDILYIYQRGIYQFQYYAEKYGYQEGDYIIGVDDLDQYDGKKLSIAEEERYKKDLNKLLGNKRVWLLFSHTLIPAERRFLNSYLDEIGIKIDTFEQPGSYVYLYDMS
ncbi:glycosyltransferase family 39 protein [Okeania sp.]|uniref:glycosyltransferase family 39 protein n=1 Tax=Okeania sp. TaxID=3100323 RepID=UPI002B4AE7DF|nr:glycosyltransferase family 39 protein [Okeania sp.]MEB3342156.1 glycosyltransferase family 39 protein [Okeania sp.]